MNQTLTVTIVYKVEHSPGTPDHLASIARNYFEGKGLTLTNELTIEI